MLWTNRPRSSFGALTAIREGDGRTIVLLHGVGLRAEAWNAQVSTLAQSYAVIAPDMAGHGESPPLKTHATLPAYADAVADALIEATKEPVVVVGHSMGGMIALDLAVRYGEHVCGVVALNAIFRRSSDAAAAVQQRASSLDGVSVADPTVALQRWFKDLGSPEALACRQWLSEVSPAGYKTAYTVFAHADGPTDAELAAISCPALFMTGADEPNSTPAMSEAMAALAPKSRCLVLDGAAHMMPMTHAADVNDALLDFVPECFA